MAAVGGGRSTLANQGSLYHVSWRPRLPDVSERHKQRDRRQIPRGPPLEGGRLTGPLHACNYAMPLHLLHS